MTTIRVAHVMGTFHVGGIEKLVLDLCLGSRDRGFDASAFAFLEDGLFRSEFDREGIEARFLDSDPGFSPSLVARLAREFRRRRVNVVHAHHFSPLVHAAPAAALAGARVVYTEHSREFYENGRRLRVARVLDRATTVVCVSNELRDWRIANIGGSPMVINNGVPIPPPTTPERRAAARALMGVPAGAFVVVCVARMVADKDHATLVRAMGLLAAEIPNAWLVLVGSGPEAEAVGAAVRASELVSRTRLLGERRDVGALLPGCDLAALASRREGLPVALLEAMACGVPFVATDVGEIGSLAAEGAGSIVQPGDVAGLAAAIRGYVEDAPRRRRDGERARALAERSYSGEAMVDRYCAVYRGQVSRNV